MACKEGTFDVVELMINDQFKTFSINLNAQQHVNGMTPFDLALSTVIRYSRVMCITVYVKIPRFFFKPEISCLEKEAYQGHPAIAAANILWQ